MTRLWRLALLACFLAGPRLGASESTPLYQSTAAGRSAAPVPLTLRDASRDDRWLGVPVRDVRFSPDGKSVYFRWHPSPSPSDIPEADPWYRVDRSGDLVERVPDDLIHSIPSESPSWTLDGSRSCWAREKSLYVYDASAAKTQQALSLALPIKDARVRPDGAACDFQVEEDLFRYDIDRRSLRQLTHKVTKRDAHPSESDQWREQEELSLFERIRTQKEHESAVSTYERGLEPDAPQIIEIEPDVELEDVRLSPDERFLTFRAHKPSAARRPTKYLDYVTRSGSSEVLEARPKVGDLEDESRLGILPFDPKSEPEDVTIRWVDVSSVSAEPSIVYGPYWNLESNRSVVQIVSTGHRDRWIAELDVETGTTKVLVHDHDDAWLGGPPPVAGYLEPALLEWIPGDRFAFASERSGWSHLYLLERGKDPQALTAGEWEVRDAKLSRDRTRWLITGSREDPCDDHLYTMPAAGGDLVALTSEPGRQNGFLSPDGERLALVRSQSFQLPDLFLRDARPSSEEVQVTVSGTDELLRHDWVWPEVVSFPHPDGKAVWAALYEPRNSSPERPAVVHIHGGGYRQFSHRGFSVYGYGLHLGLLQYLVQSGYTVLDLDYRGSAGFGRDYRTDIYRSMGDKDVESAVAGARYLVQEHGIDPTRIGIYGVSYGGFLTLMSQFRHPGVFTAGVADAAVTDWAHYQDLWTSRILNLPASDPEAYRSSSPIYFAEGLRDHLLIVHGLVDDNVHFQDAARLIQKLIELEKNFDVMVYPTERHTIETEPSRYDYVRRVVAFFGEHLIRH
ncbi:MAG TPA: prolyl oligopeptidase family serine peptidase [Vicinamibacteria bacterium]|nr:prolyl oligopeptidase family serine peptidase [Vicinamibacteria bacterium]